MVTCAVVIAEGGPRGAAVRALVESWTRAGILEGSLWVSPDGVDSSAAGPPRVAATYIDRGGSREVDLFEHVGRFRLDVVRVVVAHLLVADRGADAATVKAGAAVSAALEAVLPRRPDSAQDVGTRLHRAVVVIPTTGAVGGTTDVFQPEWEINVVLSPEDRPDLDRASVVVRLPGNFDGHAAAGIAAIGGFLRGVGAGVLDDQTTDSTSHDADAVVARVSVRSIVGQDVLDHLLATVLEPANLGAVGPAPVLTWARPATRPGLIAREAAGHLLARSQWAPSPRPEEVRPQAGHQRFWAALRTAATFNLRTVGAVISWELTRGRESVERGATEAIVGAKGGALVTLGPRPVEDLARASERLLHGERQRLDESLRLAATRAAAPEPETWTELRRVAFGLADGGELGGLPEPRQAGKRELLPAAAVAVSPGETWPADDGRLVPADDPVTMRRHGRRLEKAVLEARAELERHEHALQVALEERQRSEVDRGSAADSPPPPPPPDPGEVEAGQPRRKRERTVAPPAVRPDDATLEKLRSQVTSAEEALEDAQTRSSAYGAWFSRIADSMLWHLGDDVGRRIGEMRQLQEEISAGAKKESAPPSEELKRAQRSLRRWWRGIPLVALLLVATTVYLYRRRVPFPVTDWQPLTSEQMWWTVGIVAVLTLLALAVANHSFYRAVRKYEWAVEMRLARLASERATYLYAGRERARLELLYESLRDWVRIVGEVVHRPWAPHARPFEELPTEVIDAFPASMGVASQVGGDDEVSMPVLVDAYRLLYQASWASRAFERAYEAWEAAQTASTPDEGHRAVDLDTLDSALSPRRQLREFWISGDARAVLARSASTELVDAVEQGDLRLPERVVMRAGRYGDGTTVTERDFFRATATESTMFAQEAFGATARIGRRHYVARSVAWIPPSARSGLGSHTVELRDCTGPSAVRVDVSRRVPALDLSIFSSQAGSVDMAWHAGEADAGTDAESEATVAKWVQDPEASPVRRPSDGQVNRSRST